MAAQTTAQRMASLEAKFDALIDAFAADGAPKGRPAKAKAAQGFRTKAQRDAGNGFACTAKPSCERSDLRTARSSASHDPSDAHWHIAR